MATSSIRYCSIYPLLLTISLSIAQLNQFTQYVDTDGTYVWRSTSDFVPFHEQSFGNITIGHEVTMNFDFVWNGYTTSTKDSEMFFRVGADADYGGSGCYGNNNRYPALWVTNGHDDALTYLTLYLSQENQCGHHIDLTSFGSISVGTTYHMHIAWDQSELRITFNDDELFPMVHEWDRNQTSADIIGTVVPIWFSSNKFGASTYNRANGTFSNITIRSKILTDSPTSSPTIPPSLAPTTSPLEYVDAADIIVPSSQSKSTAAGVVAIAILIPLCCCIVVCCVALEQRRRHLIKQEAMEADWRSIANQKMQSRLDVSTDVDLPKSPQSTNHSPWPNPTFDAVAVYLDKFNTTFGSWRGTLRKDPTLSARYRPEHDEFDDMYQIAKNMTNREGHYRESRVSLHRDDHLHPDTADNGYHDHGTKGDELPSPDGMRTTHDIPHHEDVHGTQVVYGTNGILVPDLSPEQTPVPSGQRGHATAGMPSLDLRESDSGTPEPVRQSRPPPPAYAPVVAVERAQSKSPHTSPPPPSYDPDIAVQRAVPVMAPASRSALRLKPEDSRPQLDVDDHFSPNHRRDSGMDGQPMSVSTQAVSGHHGLESSRMLEDYDSLPVMDADQAQNTNDILYEE